MKVRCLFRTTDAAEVRKVPVGTHLTIQGKCAGRQAEGTAGHVRLDNCRLVYTSAPPANMPRLEAPRLLREYAEDQRLDYLPQPGEEKLIETEWTIRRLVKEHAADPKAFLQKYRNCILRVRGQRLQRDSSESVVTLISGDTDLLFQIECRFSAAGIKDLRRQRDREYRVRGLFTGTIDGKKLRLDNCRLDKPEAIGPMVTEDYLPHKPGRSFTVDVAQFGVPFKRKISSNVVRRQVHVQGNEGVEEVLITHMGLLTGNSLFEAGVQQKWIEQKKVRIPTPQTMGITVRRLNAGFVEIGTPYQGQNKMEILWVPLLKLEAQAGDKWKWEPPLGPHEYVLEKFDDFQGHPCAVIRETFTPAIDVLHPIETLHRYAKGLGEVEQRVWRRLDRSGNKKLLSEMKWVDNPGGGQDRNLPGKPVLKRFVPPAPAAAQPRK